MLVLLVTGVDVLCLESDRLVDLLAVFLFVLVLAEEVKDVVCNLASLVESDEASDCWVLLILFSVIESIERMRVGVIVGIRLNSVSVYMY